MKKYLEKIDINVEICNLILMQKMIYMKKFKRKILNLDETLIKEQIKLRVSFD